MTGRAWIFTIVLVVASGLGVAMHFDLGPFDGGDGVDALRTDGTLPPVAGADADAAGVAPGDADVMVLGDSVTQQSSGPIGERLAARNVSVIGLSGYRTDELLPTARDVFGGDQPPAVAVVMAGYNDVWQRTQVDGSVEEMIDLMAESPCAVWVLIPTTGPNDGTWSPARAGAYNDRVVEAAEAAGVHIETAWRDAVDDEPGDDPNRELVGPDLVHPSPDGRQRIGEVMASTVASHCP